MGLGMIIKSRRSWRNLTRYVKKSTEELVSQLQKIAEKTIEFGEQFSLTDQFYNPEWSQFLQYITHMFNQCKDLGEFEEKTDLFLRRTFGYSNIEPKNEKYFFLLLRNMVRC